LSILPSRCANIARLTINPEVANYFWRLAMDYQEKAAGDISRDPARLITRQ
jgi:hypothetical protein